MVPLISPVFRKCATHGNWEGVEGGSLGLVGFVEEEGWVWELGSWGVFAFSEGFHQATEHFAYFLCTVQEFLFLVFIQVIQPI